MVDMITAEGLRLLKGKHPLVKVLCYVNTSAEVKAESNFCYTSANSVKILRQDLKEEDEIIFVPDKYLVHYTFKKTGKKFIIWNGYCSVHVKIPSEHLIQKKKLHSKIKVVAHPECRSKVIEFADKVCST